MIHSQRRWCGLFILSQTGMSGMPASFEAWEWKGVAGVRGRGRGRGAAPVLVHGRAQVSRELPEADVADAAGQRLLQVQVPAHRSAGRRTCSPTVYAAQLQTTVY